MGNSTSDGGNVIRIFIFVLGIEDGVRDVELVFISLRHGRGAPHVLDAAEAQATFLVVVIQASSHRENAGKHFLLCFLRLGISEEARVIFLLPHLIRGRYQVDSGTSVKHYALVLRRGLCLWDDLLER